MPEVHHAGGGPCQTPPPPPPSSSCSTASPPSAACRSGRTARRRVAPDAGVPLLRTHHGGRRLRLLRVFPHRLQPAVGRHLLQLDASRRLRLDAARLRAVPGHGGAVRRRGAGRRERLCPALRQRAAGARPGAALERPGLPHGARCQLAAARPGQPARALVATSCSMGIIESDRWFGPLFTALRLTRTHQPIEFSSDYRCSKPSRCPAAFTRINLEQL